MHLTGNVESKLNDVLREAFTNITVVGRFFSYICRFLCCLNVVSTKR